MNVSEQHIRTTTPNFKILQYLRPIIIHSCLRYVHAHSYKASSTMQD